MKPPIMQAILFLMLIWCPVLRAEQQSPSDVTVKSEHANIGMGYGPDVILKNTHTDAQWFGDAGLGLFIHWGIASVMFVFMGCPTPWLEK